jgi:hypothetical protein
MSLADRIAKLEAALSAAIPPLPVPGAGAPVMFITLPTDCIDAETRMSVVLGEQRLQQDEGESDDDFSQRAIEAAQALHSGDPMEPIFIVATRDRAEKSQI